MSDARVQLLNRLSHLRFAIPVVVVLALFAVAVNEWTYAETTRTLKGGIELTDARIGTARVLQLLTDVETAQRGYLLTGKGDYLAPLDAATAELPAARQTLRSFLTSSGPQGAEAAARLDAAIDAKLLELRRTLSLVDSGDRAGAMRIIESGIGQGRMAEIRNVFSSSLSLAASLQQVARVSLYDALMINRLALTTLGVLGALGSILFIRRVRLYDHERANRQQELERQVELRTAELRELAGHLQNAREDEKATLARELHDELGGLLTAVKLDLARLRSKMPDDPAMLERLAHANACLNDGIALKRRVIEDLRPSALTNLGLAASLRILCSETSAGLGIPIEADIAEVSADPDVELALYRLVQESLTNIGKYAQAAAVSVRLNQAQGRLHLEVSDNGVGFDTSVAATGKHGVAGMKFRVASLGGMLDVESAPGEGTTLRVSLAPSIGPAGR